MEKPPVISETIADKPKEGSGKNKSLAFEVEFGKGEEINKTVEKLAGIQEAILSDNVTKEKMEAIRQFIKELYANQGETLKRKGWEAYNQRLPEGMRYVKAPESYERFTTKETLEGHTGMVRTLQVLPDGRIVSGSKDKTIKIWEQGPDGKYADKETLKGHTDMVFTLQVLPDGRIVSGSDDKTIKIWSE